MTTLATPTTVPAVEVLHLNVDYYRDGSPHPAIKDINLSVSSGEAVGIVGESGSGKSTLLFRILGYEPQNSRTHGRIRIVGEDILGISPKALDSVRGRIICLVPQNPLTSLAPNLTIGAQMRDAQTVHGRSKGAARTRALSMLEAVHIARPSEALGKYPHQFSGGQLQRMVIAMAMLNEPDVLVLDEPTTGLDVTTQAQVLKVVSELRARFETTILYVSHDLSVVREVCDRIVVMLNGAIVEDSPTEDVFTAPRHPYTRRLIDALSGSPATPDSQTVSGLPINSMPESEGCTYASRCPFATTECSDAPPSLRMLSGGTLVACHRATELMTWAPTHTKMRSRSGASPRGVVLSANGIELTYGSGTRQFTALHGVDLEVARGEVVALVGESGSGKTSLAKVITGLVRQNAGTVSLNGEVLAPSYRQRTLAARRQVQLVPQNPDASLNPYERVRDVLAVPLRRYRGIERREVGREVANLLEQVHLHPAMAERTTRALSGGERQRVAIARALAAKPEVLLCDEILSALDVSTQQGIRDLLISLRDSDEIAILFVSHDLSVVRRFSDRVAVLYRGQICQTGPTSEVFAWPRHPYTDELIRSIPGEYHPVTGSEGPKQGMPSAVLESNGGCQFVARCPVGLPDVCPVTDPPMRQMSEANVIYCHRESSSLMAGQSGESERDSADGT
jgi:peptide/nickel transport system ATP-binding protein